MSSMNHAVRQLGDALLLSHIKPEMREMVLRLFGDRFIKFVQIRLKPCGAIGAGEGGDSLEPSDLFLELLSALVTNNVDEILSVDHRARSTFDGQKEPILRC